VAHSPQRALHVEFFHPNLTKALAFEAHLTTICSVPVGADLNLLWLGLKMIIFGAGSVRALWISGMAR
jgi:hypothetical protein